MMTRHTTSHRPARMPAPARRRRDMLRRRVDATLGMFGLVSLGLVSFGLVCGIAVDRVQAAHERAAVLKPYQESLQQRNRQLMAIELQTHGRHEAFQREWRQRL